MINKHQLKQVATVGILCVGLLPNGAVAMWGDIREYRVPSKQHVLLKKLGLEKIRLREEAAEDVNRGEAASMRRVLYLPSNPGELVIGLCMLLDHAKEGTEGTPSLAFMHYVSYGPTPPGYHTDSGRLVALCDSRFPTKGPQHTRIEIDLKGWMQAYPEKLSVLPPAAWHTQWEGAVGLAFTMPEGPLHVYFPTRYGGLAPTACGGGCVWKITREYPERVPKLLGYKLYTTQMLHALASEGAPRFDALWVFYDSGMEDRSNKDHLYFNHGSHMRIANQTNDYAHHQTLRWGTSLDSPEEREAFYTKMWAHMLQHSEPDLMKQLRALEAEEDVPYLRELEEEGRLDEKLWPEQPFTFRQMSLLQAYATMSLPMCYSDRGHIGETKDGERIYSLWYHGEIWVHGGAELPVPDGLWDGRFKLFPHSHAHMINLGDLTSNGGGKVPLRCPRGSYDHFRDGIQCGLAKRENIWWLKLGWKTVADLKHVALLVQSVWEAPGRFYYEKVAEVPQPVPAPPLPEPEEDRKPAARPTERPEKDKDKHTADSLIEEDPERSRGWWSSIWGANNTPTAATSTAIVPFIAKNSKTAAVGLGVTAVIGGVYYHYNNAQPSKRVSAPSDKLELKFASDEDGKAFKVDISCNGESIKTTLKQERENTRNLCISPESTHVIHNIYLFVLLEDPTGKVTIKEVEKGAIHKTDWLGRDRIEDNVSSALKSIMKKVKGPSSWNWIPGIDNVSKPNPIGYLFISDFKLANREAFHKLEEAIKDRLYKEDPISRIYIKNWADSEEAKQSPYADDIQIRIITTRGDIKFSTNPESST